MPAKPLPGGEGSAAFYQAFGTRYPAPLDDHVHMRMHLNEGSGYGFRTERYLSEQETALPTSCRMARPTH